MSKRVSRRAASSKRIKTSHKKTINNKKIIYSKIDAQYKNINERVTKYVEEMTKQTPQEKQESKAAGFITIDEEMTLDQIKNLLNKDEPKRDRIRLSLDDRLYLEPLLRKYGENYDMMAKDVKLNKMQWNAHQISKKHAEYKKL